MNQKLEKFIKDHQSSFRFDCDLKNINWFRVGGKAKMMFRPKDNDELQEFLMARGKELDIFVMGVGSNIIIRDGGFDGCIIRLGRAWTNISVFEDKKIKTGVANLDLNVAIFAQQNEIAGLEFLSGIPGGIGGAIKMNAGSYGSEMKDVFVEATGFDLDGNKVSYNLSDMNFSYRKSNLDKEIIWTELILQGKRGKKELIEQEIKAIKEKRENTQPIREKTGGSTFKNPDGYKAWKLIDQAGCRGLIVGDAMMSEKHCNFMINRGEALAKDLEDLGKLVRKKVAEKTNIMLKWEIKLIGQKLL